MDLGLVSVNGQSDALYGSFYCPSEPDLHVHPCSLILTLFLILSSQIFSRQKILISLKLQQKELKRLFLNKNGKFAFFFEGKRSGAVIGIKFIFCHFTPASFSHDFVIFRFSPFFRLLKSDPIVEIFFHFFSSSLDSRDDCASDQNSERFSSQTKEAERLF